MKLLYFASVREAVGVSSEEYAFPQELRSVAEALDWLSGQSEEHAAAFSDHAKLRFALDQNMATADTLIGDAHELAIFPPVTGG